MYNIILRYNGWIVKFVGVKASGQVSGFRPT